MKFCKHLNRIIDISNPEWSPFWMKYKLMKTLIKSLPVVVMDDSIEMNDYVAIRKNPNEVKFFKQLHDEVRKVSSFFAQAKAELEIRYNRIKVGWEILSRCESKSHHNNLNLYESSVYNLHSNLLLLETFAIINYCAFSKILKKHDKKTRYKTRISFMANVVNKSNFATYPDMLAMIRQCEALYDHLSQRLVCKENKSVREDEQENIGMLCSLKNQDLDTKGDTTFVNKSFSQKRNLAILPVEIKPIIAREPSKMETSMQSIVKFKRNLGSLSKHPVCVSSMVVTKAREKGNNAAAVMSNHDDKEQHICLSPCQSSKKQRCL